MDVWQTVMKNLSATTDYASEAFFFRVMGLYRRASDHEIKPWNGEYKLGSSSEYEWRIFHFHPESDAHKTTSVSTMIQVTSTSEDITSVTSPVTRHRLLIRSQVIPLPDERHYVHGVHFLHHQV